MGRQLGVAGGGRGRNDVVEYSPTTSGKAVGDCMEEVWAGFVVELAVLSFQHCCGYMILGILYNEL